MRRRKSMYNTTSATEAANPQTRLPDKPSVLRFHRRMAYIFRKSLAQDDTEKMSLSCFDGSRDKPSTARRPKDAPFQLRTISAPGAITATTILAGRRVAVF